MRAGIPVNVVEGTRFLELALTRVGCTSKFDRPYGVGLGLHGIGLKAVNALSARVVVESRVATVRSGGRNTSAAMPCGPVRVSRRLRHDRHDGHSFGPTR